MNIFAKALAGANLSPAERAGLRLVKVVGAAVFAYLLSGQGLAVLNALQAPGANVGAILHDALLMPVLMVVLLTLDKYSSAKGDAPLNEAVKVAESLTGTNEAKVPLAPPWLSVSDPTPAAVTVPAAPNTTNGTVTITNPVVGVSVTQ